MKLWTIPILFILLVFICFLRFRKILFVSNKKNEAAIENNKYQEELLKLSKAVEEIQTIIIITDKDGVIEYINRYFIDLTGFTKEEAIGKTPNILNSGYHNQYWYKNLWDSINQGKTWRGDFRNKKKNGSLFWSSASISPIKNNSGEITNFVSIQEDITVKKIIHNELKKAKQSAESAIKAKSDFLATISHEIRTPLNSIIGMNHILKNTELNNRQIDYVNKMMNSANKLLEIINDILDFSKIESGKLKIDINPFDLKDLMNNVYNNLSPKAKEKGLEFKIDIDANIPYKFIGDPARIEQVILNLLNNAIKFTEKGEILVSINIISSVDDTFFIKFAVKDTGIGIKEEDRDKIFQSFSQADSAISRKYGGTGLGLSISKRIIELMGGDIWFESEYGKGSIFVFALELESYQEKIENIQNADSNKLKNKPINILLVEDDNINQEIMKMLIEHNGFDVDISSSGEETLKKLYNSPANCYNLILMDINMPEMDGYETSLEIRKNIRFNDIPIIALSGDIVEKDMALKSGMNDYISKPINSNELLGIIQKWINPENKNSNNKKFDIISKNSEIIKIPQIIDLKEGIGRIGNEIKYKKILKKFLDNNKFTLNDIKNAIERNDFESAKGLTHTLKGVSGNIAAQKLHIAAKELENAIKEKKITDIPNYIANTEKEITEFFENIKLMTDDEEYDGNELIKEDISSIDKNKLSELINDLRRSLEDDDAEAINNFALLKENIKNSKFNEEIGKMEQFINKYNFSEALLILNKLII